MLSKVEVLNSVPKTETGAIDLTKAKRIAEGGTHTLYRFPDAPFVIKVMKRKSSEEEIEELEKKYAVLYAAFDKNDKKRCIREEHITHSVLLPEKEPEDVVISIVPYEHCFQSNIKFDFKIEPSELDPYVVEHNVSLFAKANKAFIYNDESVTGFDPNEYIKIDPLIGAIILKLDDDPKLREVMAEFLNNYREFYQKTNIILDAMGYENILFFKDNEGDWQYKVGSTIKHDTGKFTNELFAALHVGQKINADEFVTFTHKHFSPANIRAVNVCAMKLGLEPIISDVRIHSQDLFKVVQELPIAERMLSYARHGDFATVSQLLNDNKDHLTFNLSDFWAYPLIAEEFTKQKQPIIALKEYLDIVSAFPIIPTSKKEDQKRIEDTQQNILNRQSTLLQSECGILISQNFKQQLQETKLNEQSFIPSEVPVFL